MRPLLQLVHSIPAAAPGSHTPVFGRKNESDGSRSLGLAERGGGGVDGVNALVEERKRQRIRKADIQMPANMSIITIAT